MKIYVSLVSYNGMGGHPTLSFLGDLILGSSAPSFGNAVTEIESYAHLDSANSPLPTLESMWQRFRERVATMPQAWFRRKNKRIEVAYYSQLGLADDLIQGRPRRARLEDVPLIRTGYRELIQVLEIVRKKTKAVDAFDATAFVDFLASRRSALDNESDDGIQKLVCHYQDVERQRVATTDDRL